MALRWGKRGLTSVHESKIIKQTIQYFKHKFTLTNQVTYSQNKLKQSYLNCLEKKTVSGPREGIISLSHSQANCKNLFLFLGVTFFQKVTTKELHASSSMVYEACGCISQGPVWACCQWTDRTRTKDSSLDKGPRGDSTLGDDRKMFSCYW